MRDPGDLTLVRAEGLGMLVAQTDVPVVPCYLDGAFAALKPNQKLPRPSKIKLTIGRPMVFTSVNNDRPGWEQIAAPEVRGDILALALMSRRAIAVATELGIVVIDIPRTTL